MSDVLTEARSKIEAGLAEINEERQRLERALSHLTTSNGGSSRKARRKPSGGSPGVPGRKRKKQAPKGQRREEVLTTVTKDPGITAAKVAKKLNISPSQASSVAKGLRDEKLVTKKGPAYTAKSQPKAKKPKSPAT
jgi:CRP-like cAMP-binding protein